MILRTTGVVVIDLFLIFISIVNDSIDYVYKDIDSFIAQAFLGLGRNLFYILKAYQRGSL